MKALTAQVRALASLGKEVLADNSWEPDDADIAGGESAMCSALGSALAAAAALVGNGNDEGEELLTLSERSAQIAERFEELAVELDARKRAEVNEDDGSAWERASLPPGFDVAAHFLRLLTDSGSRSRLSSDSKK